MSPDYINTSNNSLTQTDIVIGIIISTVVLALFYLDRRYALYSNIRQALFPNSQLDEVDNNDAMIMAYYTKGHSLMNVSAGQADGMAYSAFLTTKMQQGTYKDEQNTDAEAIIYNLHLPFNTQGHLIGISKKYAVSGEFLESFLIQSGMEEIVLEGDFVDAFKLYAADNQDVIARYILDPAAMAFVMDYCANNFWEIAGTEMYFVAESSQKGGMDILKSTAQFVQEIKPAVASKSSN